MVFSVNPARIGPGLAKMVKMRNCKDTGQLTIYPPVSPCFFSGPDDSHSTEDALQKAL